MDRIIDRLEKFLCIKGITDKHFQEECGLANGTLTQARSNKCSLSRKTIQKIVTHYPELNNVWLVTGEGEMLKESNNVKNVGNNSTAIAGSGINFNNSVLLDKALSEIAEQRKLVAQGQEQISRLISLLEKK